MADEYQDYRNQLNRAEESQLELQRLALEAKDPQLLEWRVRGVEAAQRLVQRLQRKLKELESNSK